jgi:hypothetical protein
MNIRKIISAIAVLAMIAGTLVFNSCSKQDEVLKTEETTNDEGDYKIFYELSSFAEKMEFIKENPDYKSGESLEVDSALWLMEGAMNLTYGFPFEEYGEFITGTDVITLTKNNAGEIDMDEIGLKYQEIIEKARVLYYNASYEEKGLMVLNMEKEAENENEVTFEIETVTGDKSNDPWPFGQGENWWYGEDEGGCEGNNASASDAAHELAATYPTYNITDCMSIAGPGFVEVTGGEQWLRRPGDEMDNQYDYYIFCVKDNVEPFVYDDNLCLLYNKMSIYYAYLDNVITNYARVHGGIPEGHVFIDFNENKGYSVVIYPNNNKYIHYFELMYGLPFDKPNCNPPVEL